MIIENAKQYRIHTQMKTEKKLSRKNMIVKRYSIFKIECLRINLTENYIGFPSEKIIYLSKII